MFKYIAYTKVIDEFTTHQFIEIDDRCQVNRFDVPYVSVEYENESDFVELMAYQPVVINATEITKEEFDVAVYNSAQMQRVRSVAKKTGKIYSIGGVDYLIPLTKEAQDTVLAVGISFYLQGISSTVVQFENGTKLPLDTTTWQPFAIWFATERNAFFGA
ncbi:MAG: hypothetical protein WC179_06965 [Candidatus Cloacimonadaceae bacterium]